jgi:2-C-methyl-D-erythritol 4-phosphate cytidylyltransferase
MVKTVKSAPQVLALIPAAGVGARAGGATPKQYQLIAGASVLEHTLRAFAACARVQKTVVAVSANDGWINAVSKSETTEIVRCGGATRAHTVRNALVELRRRYDPQTWVLVHDAARCCITPTLIDALIDACIDDPVGGLLALPASDTLKRASHGPRSGETIDRSEVWAAQTPQLFHLGALSDALSGGDLSAITDEASAMERAGLAPKLVLGASTNLKVTYPEDFMLAEAILCHAAQSRPG